MDTATRIRNTRDRIRTEDLVELLHDQAFGKIKLSHGALRAAEILLRKALPDLLHQMVRVTEHSGFHVEIVEPFAGPQDEVSQHAAAHEIEQSIQAPPPRAPPWVSHELP